MDDATLQIMVFGSIIAAIAAFGSYMAARQKKTDSELEAAKPDTLL